MKYENKSQKYRARKHIVLTIRFQRKDAKPPRRK